MKRILSMSMLAGALFAAGCRDLNVPDYNEPLLGDLETRPTSGLVNAATVGMLDASRQDAANYIRYTGIVGREAYYLDTNESRYITELVGGVMDPSSFAGGGLWTNRYRSIRTGNVIIGALDKLPANDDLSAAQKEGVRGFVKLVQAIDLLAVANTRQTAPVDIAESATADPAPLVDQAALRTRIYKLLDESFVHLGAAGSSFSFALPTGFTQFGLQTPAKMKLVNRAIRARVDILNLSYAQALTDVNASFVSTAASDRAALNSGVYYNFSANSGDLPNALTSASPQVADTLLRTNAQFQADGTTRDARYGLKVGSRSNRAFLNISSNLNFALYNTKPFYGSGGQASPIPVIRNEELILIRAEAKWKTGDLPGAITDLNFVRTNSGGLVARADLTDANFLSALLYERRYSLLYEGGFRWMDLRRYGMLGTLANYPRAGDVSPSYFPIPFAECLARPAGTPGCSAH
ncbi:MAG: putative lipoprotein [Gemmatimonadetes bacterium]|nr:putative lipoprotein [Gemmatimonadota bacterium]